LAELKKKGDKSSGVEKSVEQLSDCQSINVSEESEEASVSLSSCHGTAGLAWPARKIERMSVQSSIIKRKKWQIS